jgi:PPP family 3-phenylpropionic acid transporter
MLAMIVTGVRLLLYAVSGSPALVVFIQLLNGLSFPAMWMAGVAYADENAPAGMGATAQGMFGAMVMGFGAAVGGFVGGPLLENMGGRGLYLVFGVVVLAIVGFAALMRKRPLKEQTPPPPAGE